MTREEVIFSNLPEIVREKELVTKQRTKKTWQAVPYETDQISGVMLGAFTESYPKTVSLQLNLSGWYKVYVGLFCAMGESLTFLKLSNQKGWTQASFNAKFAPKMWKTIEYAQEMFLFAADITGVDLEICRPVSAYPNTSAVMWIRCVPVAEEELEGVKTEFSDKKNQTMHMHLDTNLTVVHAPKNLDEYCMYNYAFEASDAEVISQEISFEFSKELTLEDVRKDCVIDRMDRGWSMNDVKYLQKRKQIAKKRIRLAHDMGRKIYAANRMQISNFGFPYHRPAWNMQFFEEHPEYRAVWGDGQVMGFLSYAYPEVRTYMANQLIEHLKLGYDGLTLFWHRGMHVGFEQPVQELFCAKYPDVNLCELPMSDARLHGIWEDVLTELLTLLRQKVRELEIAENRKISIHVIGGYNISEDRNLGVNFRRWAEEGLIDEASQADMETYEILDGCMQSDAPDKIEIEKYRQLGRTQKVIWRTHGTRPEKQLAGLPGYLELEEKWGIKVYHALPWVNSRTPEEYIDAAKTLYAAGAKRLHMWNTLQCMPDLAEWNVVKRLGHREELERLYKEQYSQYIKILSVGGMDIRYFNPCWRG